MSAFYYRLRNFFPFKTPTNFLITFTTVSSTGYCIYRYNLDKKFEHSVIKESLRLINTSRQLIEMLGYPIDIRMGVTKCRVDITPNANVYEFVVHGPRASISVSMVAESKAQSEITTEELCNEYYIPDTNLKSTLEEKKLKGQLEELKSTKIPGEEKFWKIKKLVADISPDYRIAVVEDVKKPLIPGESPKNREFLIDILQEENQRLKKNSDIMVEKTEEEIEESRRFRLRKTYQKVAYIRNYMFGLGLMGFMLSYIYITKNKRMRIEGSDIQFLMQEIVKKDPFVKNKFGNVKFMTTTRGNIVGKDAIIEQDFINNRGDLGTVFAKGTKDEKSTFKWKFHSLKVGKKNKKGEISDLQKLI